jgi:uncharacterized protein YggE
MRKKFIVGLGFLVSILFISACGSMPALEGDDGIEASHNTIQVVGNGIAQGDPDIASIQLGVNLVDTDLERVIENANQSIEGITQALVGAGVLRQDIQTTNYGIWPEDVYDRMTGEPTGERKYHSDITIDVTIRDIGRMGEFIKVGLDAGVNNIYGINFGLDERAALESEARAEAISNARARAEELALGIGKRVGETLSISEGVIGAPSYGVGAARFEGIGGGGGAPISPGQSTVRVEVIVVYELID